MRLRFHLEALQQVEEWLDVRPLPGVERNLTLAAVVERLPDVEQEIVRLRFVEGLTQLEIAQRVGRSQMQISRLLARTLDRLRGWITEGPAS